MFHGTWGYLHKINPKLLKKFDPSNVVVIQWQKFLIFLWLFFSSILSYSSVFLTQPLAYQQLWFKNKILQLNLPLVTSDRISFTPLDQKLRVHQYTHSANCSYRHQNHKPLKTSIWPQKHIYTQIDPRKQFTESWLHDGIRSYGHY
jgi:hypothetical protein